MFYGFVTTVHGLGRSQFWCLRCTRASSRCFGDAVQSRPSRSTFGGHRHSLLTPARDTLSRKRWPQMNQNGGGEGPDNSKVKRTSREMAKELLTLYGPVYLGTSISFAAISFAFFYVLVSSGVDVRHFVEVFGDWLEKTPIGRPAVLDQLSPQIGAVALAYIAHKATSPLRFPLTVAAVPFVAKLLKKRPQAS